MQMNAMIKITQSNKQRDNIPGNSTIAFTTNRMALLFIHIIYISREPLV